MAEITQQLEKHQVQNNSFHSFQSMIRHIEEHIEHAFLKESVFVCVKYLLNRLNVC